MQILRTRISHRDCREFKVVKVYYNKGKDSQDDVLIKLEIIEDEDEV